jgi:hypothetical protein
VTRVGTIDVDYTLRVQLDPRAENNGLANMVAGLILQNLQDRPEKRADFAKLRGVICIVAEDAGVAMTLVFSGDKLVVHDGILGIPDVTVRAQSDDIVQMSLMELTKRFGLPDPRGPALREIVKKSRSGQVRAFGALLHVPMLLRFSRLMSVH